MIAAQSPAAQQERQQAFQALRPVCAGLLQLRSSPDELRASLQHLDGVLAQVSPAGLQACWDYVCFPLLLLVDSVQQCRQGDGAAAAAAAQELPVPAARSDRVAEAALSCVKTLHSR
jgi:hypothetical protein